MNLKLSPLGHTWILDLDGTIVKHNGYKIDGYDSFLVGAENFLNRIPERDMIIFVTSRTEDEKVQTENFLKKYSIRYDFIIYDAPFGERIVINDCKPTGLKTSVAINRNRDSTDNFDYEIDKNL